MRPLLAHCHLGLGKLYRRTSKPEQAAGAPPHRDDDVPRDGHALLAGAGGGDHGCTSVRNCRGVMTRSGTPARRSIQRPKSATSPVTKWVAWAAIAAARSGRSFEDSSGGVSRSTSAGAGSLTTRTAVRLLRRAGSAAGRFASRFRSASTIARGEVRSVTRPAAPSSTRSAESSLRAVCGGEEDVGVEEDTEVSHDCDGAARPASSPSAGGAPSAHAG